MGTPKEKAAAAARGDAKYFTGRRCRRGHIAERYTATGNCVECAIAYSRKWRVDTAAEDPEWHRKRLLRSKYGLTFEQYEKMLSDQRGRCAVCLRSFTETPFVDHCHRQSKVRNLLCRGCNTALGHAQDDPAILRALADYIEAHRS